MTSVSSLVVETKGLRELDKATESSREGDERDAIYPTSGVPALDENGIGSSLSTLRTRTQMCLQIASEILGPCPSFSHSCRVASELGVGFTALGLGVEDTRYRTRPIVLGSAYSLAIATSCPWSDWWRGTSVPRSYCEWYPEALAGSGVYWDSSAAWARSFGGTMWRRNLEVMEVVTVCSELAEGVGERNMGFASEGGERTGDILMGMGPVAGRGVETPSALASFANLCGGNGWRGGGHTGRN